MFTRTSRANNHVVRTKFKHPFPAIRQRGRRVRVALQSQVETEPKRSIFRAMYKNFSTDQFLCSILIIVARRIHKTSHGLWDAEYNGFEKQVPNTKIRRAGW